MVYVKCFINFNKNLCGDAFNKNLMINNWILNDNIECKDCRLDQILVTFSSEFNFHIILNKIIINLILLVNYGSKLNFVVNRNEENFGQLFGKSNS